MEIVKKLMSHMDTSEGASEWGGGERRREKGKLRGRW